MKNRIRTMLLSALFIFIPVLFTGCGKKEEALFIEAPGSMEAEAESEDANQEIQPEELQPQTASGVSTLEESLCYVHICGAVKNPGVYEIEGTGRLYEAILLAGGFTEEACGDYLNQAKLVTDGEQIRVPTKEEAEKWGENQSVNPAEESKGGLININTATAAELCTLPGIGTQKATLIISFREQNGSFAAKEELQKVEGIKEGTYQKLKDSITVS